MANLFTLRVFCKKSAERKPPKKYIHIFVLMSDLEQVEIQEIDKLLLNYNSYTESKHNDSEVFKTAVECWMLV